MYKTFLFVALGLLSLPVSAQSRIALMEELEAKELEANDAASTLAVALWAKENGMRTDHLRLVTKVIQLDPDNETARTALGYVKHEGKWMMEAKLALLAERADRQEKLDRGLVEVGGIWVTEAEAADAERGVFHHDGALVSRGEKEALMAGKVRHPVTGSFIDPDDAEKAEAGQFPLADGEWGNEEEADRYHSTLARPWVVRGQHLDIATTLPLSKHEEIKGHIDGAIQVAQAFFGARELHPGFRPVLIVCATTAEYQQVGNQIGDEASSADGAFVAVNQPTMPGVTFSGNPVVANWGEREPWGLYYLRHAAGMAYAAALGREAGVGLPPWMITGSGSLCEYHAFPEIAQFFGRSHLESGGIVGLESWDLGSLEKWFGAFRVSTTLPPARVKHNIYQSGLLLAFCLDTSDESVKAAAAKVRESLDEGGGAVAEATAALQTLLTQKETELWAYLKQVVEG